MVRLGAHMSISGGVDTAFDRGEEVGCDAMQIFTKNNNQWRAAPLKEKSIERYHQRQAETGITPVVAHSSYLLNLASPKDELWHKSIDALVIEMERCDMLNIPYLVIHPGSHVGSGEEAGIARIVEGLNIAHDRLSNAQVKITLETTAGQGTNLGHRFEHLAAMIDGVEAGDRLAVCFDTCHTLAAGYDFRTPEGYAEVFKQFGGIIGLERLAVFHFNDSKQDLDSRVDRHAHIGEGFVGLDGFRHILNDARFQEIPMLLETPKSKDMHEDVENLAQLRALIAE
ncbi:MAG: deoxyribonuclease IV [Anaerolineae bacterium]|jgi:deoxyribonuclease-4